MSFTAYTTCLKNQWRRRPLHLQLFLLLCFNLVLAPAVKAASRIELAPGQAYAITLLGLVTLGVSIYLFVVIFQPERF
jgi:K+-transporting ATPase KdpF subunit